MPILSQVGRRSPAQIAARTLIYAALTFGAATIVYPLLIVIGQTLSDQFDLRDNAIVPAYLYDRNELLLKYIFNETNRINLLASRYHRNTWTSQTRMRDDHGYYRQSLTGFPERGLNLEAWQTIVADLNAFKQTLDPDDLLARQFRIEDWYRPFLRHEYERKAKEFLKRYGRPGTQLPAWFTRAYSPEQRRRILRSTERLAVAILNYELQSDYRNFFDVEVLKPGNFLMPVWRPDDSPRFRLWRRFKASLPPEQKLIINSDAYWHDYLISKYRRIDLLNKAWGSRHQGFYELRLPFRAPDNPAVRADWETFMIKRWPRRLLRVPAEFAPAWRDYVKRRLLLRFGNGPDAEARALTEASRLFHRPIRAWSDIPLPETRPADDTLSRYWCEFTMSGAIPAEKIQPLAPELLFRDFLRKRYGGDGVSDRTALDRLNNAWRAHFESFQDVPLPCAFADFAIVHARPWRVRWSFVTESYRRVIEYMLGRGRAVQNTVILVVLSLLSALTINPMAAYALSRFTMKQSHRILLFFLATMAFPPEVAMIPNFLLLRDLGLLNTFAALILPRMANGFAIFLLKGFFDSLPQELYEAAEIDGASEPQVFRMVALPLLKPIMAYIGLTTFVAAYSSFMWAFVICPRQDMWTLMVWVYDFQMRNPGNNYVLAATVLVSIPPLLVFLIANRIIMRGIIIPTMK